MIPYTEKSISNNKWIQWSGRLQNIIKIIAFLHAGNETKEKIVKILCFLITSKRMKRNSDPR